MKNVTILAYHQVNDQNKSALAVRIKDFQFQMRYLAEKYEVISLDELAKKIKNGEAIKRKLAVITFDDGWEDNYINAFPILKRYGFPATIFVTTSFIGKENYLNWEEIKIMSEKGIYFGSHTLTHPSLTDISLEEAGKEILESKNIIEKKLEKPCVSFCYPRGDFNAQIKEIVAESGYSVAVVTPPKSGIKEDLFALKRLGIYEHTDELQFKLKLWGVYSLIKRR